MIKTHFVFAVSFVAMLAVSSAWANDPADTSSTTDTVATEHTVYTNQTPTSGTGIAGVSYVNKAVNKAGASAQAAEAHAAAAGASALDAASSAAAAAASAAAANETLKSKADKSELDDYATVTALNAVRTELSNGNTEAVGELQEQIDDLATVASSGSYNDLSNKPTIGNATLTIKKNGTTVDTFTANATTAKTINITVPTKVTDLSDATSYATTTAVNAKVTTAQGSSNANKAVITNSSGNITTGTITSGMITDGTIKNVDIATDAAIAASKISGLATVATSGSYSDLSNKPTIPTVNNATLTIQKNGTNVATFTANSSSAATANITVPTTVAELSDSADYATVTALNAVRTELSNGNTTAVGELQEQIDDLATVASTGSYNDLSNKPTIGASSLVVKNGATDANIAVFSANATTAVTATIPAATPSVAGLAKIGVIPSGSATSTTYATIWVE